MRRIILILTFLLSLLHKGDGQEIASRGEKDLPLLYNEVTQGIDAVDRAAEKIYSGRFKFVKATAKEGLASGRIKGYPIGIRDPRSMREWRVPLKVGLLFVVTPEGVVIEPRFLSAVEKRVADQFLRSVRYRRFVPARFRGVPVYCLHYTEQSFGGPDDSAHGEVIDGLKGFGTR